MSAADLRTVQVAEKGSATYDPDMPMGTLRGLLKAGGTGDLEGMIESLAGIIKSWPFKGSPSNPEDWDMLRRSEFMALTSAVVEDMGTLGEA